MGRRASYTIAIPCKRCRGQNVVVRFLDKVYHTGRQYAKHFKETMTIVFDEHLPKWNYTAVPEPS